MLGVLAVQGDFREHHRSLERAISSTPSYENFKTSLVRTKEEMNACDGLIIPGVTEPENS